MAIVNVHQAKSQLSQLLVRMAAGEEIVIARAGKPVGRLVPFEAPPTCRAFGAWAGQVWVSEDFDTLPDEMQAAFEGHST